MRVGIVTQPLLVNYGGILQNFALQQILKAMGHTPITLNYIPSISFGRYILYLGKRLIYAPFPSRRQPIRAFKHYQEGTVAIDTFVKHNINTTKRIPNYTKSILKKNEIEALIVGSDQVWRYAYNSHNLDDMYLAFAQDYPCIKIAYGASFGIEQWDYPQNYTEIAKKLIKQFNAISVREDSGVQLCKKELNSDAITVLDPTMLLCGHEYDRFCSVPAISDCPYLAAYVLDMTPEKETSIMRVAKEKNLKIKLIDTANNVRSIEEWLSAIKFAEYVITDSFHGSVFSLLFEKQFQTIINHGRGEDRFNTLFNKLKIQSHLVEQVNGKIEELGKIDYSIVNHIIKELRGESLSFLESSLSL